MNLHNCTCKQEEHPAVCCSPAEAVPSWVDLRFGSAVQKEEKEKTKLVLQRKIFSAFQWFEKLGLNVKKKDEKNPTHVFS